MQAGSRVARMTRFAEEFAAMTARYPKAYKYYTLALRSNLPALVECRRELGIRRGYDVQEVPSFFQVGVRSHRRQKKALKRFQAIIRTIVRHLNNGTRAPEQLGLTRRPVVRYEPVINYAAV